jgi:hypothetical protein
MIARNLGPFLAVGQYDCDGIAMSDSNGVKRPGNLLNVIPKPPVGRLRLGGKNGPCQSCP